MCRALRLVLFGFFGVSASVGALIATTQVIAALGGAERALPLADVAQSLGIDLAAAGVFAFFLRRDLQVRTCADMCAGMCLWGTVCLREPKQLLLAATANIEAELVLCPISPQAKGECEDVGSCKLAEETSGNCVASISLRSRILVSAGAGQADSAADAGGASGGVASHAGQRPPR